MTDAPNDAERLLSILEPAGPEIVAPGMRLCHPSESRIIFGFPPLRRDGKPFCPPPAGFTIFTSDKEGCDAWERGPAALVAETQRRERVETQGASDGETAEPMSGPTLVRS